jgi:hypothetical protein
VDPEVEVEGIAGVDAPAVVVTVVGLLYVTVL